MTHLMPPSKTPCARNRLYLLNHWPKVSYRCPQISQTMATAIVCTLPPDGKVLLLKMPLTYAIKHREIELEDPTPTDWSSWCWKVLCNSIREEKSNHYYHPTTSPIPCNSDVSPK